ncbi:hypothetical protein [Janthinobacterium fluminis]|uniref:HTH cro/C1-type domain-containing protein n=1 Tax=Janthinobacterium fluminis TaxID=2987524 RepID=A0ABT5JU25_9BURK|nr:hypothetical protein [Janthinobacterium fluminis]MDC8756241.1 hypothetical protein [Janthinobacterium fluminis]
MAEAKPATRDASGGLFAHLMSKLELKNYAALARALQVAPPVISKITHGRLEVGDRLILLIHEKFGLPVAEIRKLLAAPSA